MQFQHLVLIFIFLLTYRTSAQQQPGCIQRNTKTGERWRLRWEDTFDRPQVNADQWTIGDHAQGDGSQSQFCDSFLDCLSAENIRPLPGYLLVSAKFYEYENYTASKLTTGKILPPGRLEIRAKLPTDPNTITRIQASIDSSHEAFINVLVQFKGQFYQSFQMQSQLVKSSITESMLSSSGSSNGFHIFGFEWTYSGLKFFFNGHYTGVLPFGDTLARQMTARNESLQLAFEVSYPTRQMHLFKWEDGVTEVLKAKPESCTALVLDYVKVFEPVQVLQAQNHETELGPECGRSMGGGSDEQNFNQMNNRTCTVPGFGSGGVNSRQPKELNLDEPLEDEPTTEMEPEMRTSTEVQQSTTESIGTSSTEDTEFIRYMNSVTFGTTPGPSTTTPESTLQVAGSSNAFSQRKNGAANWLHFNGGPLVFLLTICSILF